MFNRNSGTSEKKPKKKPIPTKPQKKPPVSKKGTPKGQPVPKKQTPKPKSNRVKATPPKKAPREVDIPQEELFTDEPTSLTEQAESTVEETVENIEPVVKEKPKPLRKVGSSKPKDARKDKEQDTPPKGEDEPKKNRSLPFPRRKKKDVEEEPFAQDYTGDSLIVEGVRRTKMSTLLLRYLGINTVKMVSEDTVANMKADAIVMNNTVAYTSNFMNTKEFPKVSGFVDKETFGSMSNDFLTGSNPAEPQPDTVPPIALFGLEDATPEINLGDFKDDTGSSAEGTEIVFDGVEETNLFGDDSPLITEDILPQVDHSPLFVAEDETQVDPSPLFLTEDETEVATPTGDSAQSIDFSYEHTEETTDDSLLNPFSTSNPLGPVSLETQAGANTQLSSLEESDEEPKEGSIFKIAEEQAEQSVEYDAIIRTEEQPEQLEQSSQSLTEEPQSQRISLTDEDLYINSDEGDSMMMFGSASEPSAPTLETKTLTVESFANLRPKQEMEVGSSSILGVRGAEDSVDESSQIILNAVNEGNIEEQIRNADSFLDAIKLSAGGKR